MWNIGAATTSLRLFLTRLGYSPLATSGWVVALSGMLIILDRPSPGPGGTASPEGSAGG
jgi:hypothetical protein